MELDILAESLPDGKQITATRVDRMEYVFYMMADAVFKGRTWAKDLGGWVI